MFITVTNAATGDYVIVNSNYIIKVESEVIKDKKSGETEVGKIFLADPKARLMGESSPDLYPIYLLYTREQFSELEKALRSVPAD